MKKNIYALFIFLFPSTIFSQLIVNSAVTPTGIVNSFIGSGATVSNITMNCNTGAYGTFNGASSNIGMNSGALLTNGHVNNAVGPNSNALGGTCINNPAGPGDPDLTSIEANAKYDVCVLEFDITPQCSSIQIRYVFGSEEYPTFVNAAFNDAFGFFITGPTGSTTAPGSPGPSYNKTNVATLPDNVTPVSIDNVNASSNSSYFVNNSGGTTVEYNGFTTVLTRTISLCPCATYHFKIVIGDAGDCQYDSGVFIDFIQCASTFTTSAVATAPAGCSLPCVGSATANASGGVGPYTYSWSPSGGNGATATGLCAGVYTVTINDAIPCTPPQTQSVTISGSSNALTPSQTNVTCKGACNGTAGVTPSGGVPPYTYSWSNGSAGSSLSGLCAGLYSVTVSDAAGCTKSTSITITEPATGIAISIPTVIPDCDGGCSTGSAFPQRTGGTPPYTYLWSNGLTTLGATGLCSGSYTLTVTDAAGCKGTSNVSINSVTCGGGPCAGSSVTSTNVSCFGGSNGTATSIPAGSPPFKYLWTNGETTATIDSLFAIEYIVVVTDGTGCFNKSSVTITQPTALAVGTSATGATCVTPGTATATPSGGTGPYNYSWSPGGQNTATATGLAAGLYTVTVTDAKGCTKAASVSVPGVISGVVSIAYSSPACNGSTCNDTALATISGGVAPYTFLWSNAATTPKLTALCLGTYTVTVTDNDGCTSGASITITEPAAITLTTGSTKSTCGAANGTASVTPAGGTAPFTYLWSSGHTTATANMLFANTYTITVTDSKGCVKSAEAIVNDNSNGSVSIPSFTHVKCFGNSTGSATASMTGGTPPYFYSWNTTPGQFTAVATGLSAGKYIVTVTDRNGCKVRDSLTITQPPLLIISITPPINVSCKSLCNGSAIANGTGGTGAYTYSWNTIPAKSTDIADNLCAGTYTATITDANNCISTSSVIITEPDLLIVTIAPPTNVSCNGVCDGGTKASSTGGTLPYVYLWSSLPPQATDTAMNLCAGTYTVMVTDSNSCVDTASITILQPAPLTIAIDTSLNATCFDFCNGSATATGAGGTIPYTYSWNTVPSQTTQTATNLCDGIYVVTITDANGCSNSVSIVITEPALLINTPISTDSICIGFNTTIATAASGGTPPYNYVWDTQGNLGFANTSSTIVNPIVTTTYTVTITDANGCTKNDSVIIHVDLPLSLSVAGIDITCNGYCNGQTIVIPSGGSAPYSYNWSSGCTSAACSNVCPGSYTITVTDSWGCIIIDDTTLTEPPLLTATITGSTPASCFGVCDGIATVSTNGGTGSYQYSWNSTPVQTTATATNLCTGSYTCTITDANNCSAFANVTIIQPLQLSLTTITAPTICIGSSATLTTTASGGNGGYVYTWLPVGTDTDSSATVSPVVTTTYTVTVTDSKSCTATPVVVVVTVKPPLAVITSNDTAVCLNQPANLKAFASGGDGGPYNYTWTPLGTGSISGVTVTPNSTTTYTVTVTDGCGTPAANDTVVVTIWSLPVINFSASDTAGCTELCIDFSDNSSVIGGSVAKWNWDFGGDGKSILQNPSHCFVDPGKYSITLTTTSNNGCISTFTHTNMITVFALPIAEFNPSPNTATVLNPYVTLNNLSSSDVVYWFWDFGDGDTLAPNTSSPYHKYPGMEETSYTTTLIVRNVNGCYDSVEHIIIIGPDFTFYIPNAFTPNGDGINDLFFGTGIGIEQYEIDIFDRWGNLIFQGGNLSDTWNGKANGGSDIAQQDVYVWKVNLTDVFHKKHHYTGTVTIVK
ncbi:MAG: choice-of-anchor L domain-containing protein [Bacteroidota bacterium]